MSELLPPNAVPLERALEHASSRISDVPTPVAQVWDAERCPASQLPWLAWALGVETWSPEWPEGVKRERVKSAIAIARRKGTVQSVREVVRTFGASIALREWFEASPPGDPHTFEITLLINSGLPQTASYQNDIMDAVDSVKPVRSHYTLTAGVHMWGGINIHGQVRPAQHMRLSFLGE